MLSELLAFMQLGFGHIVAWDAADHILFLLVLAAVYRGRDWRAALAVISAFTVGHSITLALAVTGSLVLPTALVEFLIPVTIVAAGIENLVLRERVASGAGARYRPIFAAVFGLVHGAGFAGYLQSLFVENLAVPLLGFNIGIELGQLVVLAAAAALYLGADTALRALPRRLGWPDAYQLRMVTVSAAITIVAGVWAFERFPQWASS
ncbi:MAG: HupE/UreJ family protein [Gemmatimonadaceae bacterium]|nr:HupE/UreJ family protein [Gemmatimonadaceae bacterium]